MPAERFYLNESFVEGKTCSLTDSELHHLVRVMRAQAGSTIELVNGKGALAEAVVNGIDKKYAELEIKNVEQISPPAHEIILAQALPRGNRLDFIVEKCTELGMTQLWLFPGKHSERKELSENQTARIEALMVAAMKQSGTLWLPKFAWLPPLHQWKPLPAGASAFFGDLSKQAPLLIEQWRDKKEIKNVIFFVGPEAGFTDQEEECLQKLGAKGVKLHTHILRTDTAGIMATGLIHHCLLFSGN
jgi:16S rRNA (uracil1498-N3)-methyltransferase